MLRPTFLGFETARRGIATSQKGLDVTGQNMTNWDTPGYTRQRIDQVSIAASAYKERFATNRVSVAGQGVDISGISQTRDSFLDKRFRDEYSDVGYYDEANNILADIESAIGEYKPTDDSGIRGSLKAMFTALQNFSNNPYSETHANIVASEFKNMTQTLQQLDAKLTNVAEQQKYNLSVAVDEVNSILEKVAELNKTISEDLGIVGSGNAHYGPNELLDERNLLLDDLARFGNIEVTKHSDATVSVKMNGHTVVEGKKFDTLSMQRDDETSTVGLYWVSSGDKVDIETGALKAMTDFINGRGTNVSNVGESPYRGVLYYRDKLNAFASTLVNVANSTIPDAVDDDGNPTGYRQLLGALTTNAAGEYEVTVDVPITAANISLSDAWTEDSSYVIFKTDSKNNNFALNLANKLASSDLEFTEPGGVTKATFYEFVDSYSSVLAEDISFHTSRHEASASIANEMLDRRDEVSGVVVDEEVANMMMYGKSLQAASRLMTALDEALDVIVNKTGVVGR